MRLIIGPRKLNLHKADEFADMINSPFSDFKGQVYSAFCDVDGVSCKITIFLVVLKEQESFFRNVESQKFGIGGKGVDALLRGVNHALC